MVLKDCHEVMNNVKCQNGFCLSFLFVSNTVPVILNSVVDCTENMFGFSIRCGNMCIVELSTSPFFRVDSDVK